MFGFPTVSSRTEHVPCRLSAAITTARRAPGSYLPPSLLEPLSPLNGREYLLPSEILPAHAPIRQWTHAQGPVTVYMANCNGPCSSVSSNSLKWFKIAETGAHLLYFGRESTYTVLVRIDLWDSGVSRNLRCYHTKTST